MADHGAPLLPELVRSLRSLGRPTDKAAEVAHGVVFAPLLDARARASQGDAADAIAAISAFRGSALAARIESLARTAATDGQVDPARGRARAAAAREVLDPLRLELLALDQLAPDASRDGAGSAGWQRWLDQLRRVFTSADAACDALARLLAEGTAAPPTDRAWFRRGSTSR